MLFVYLVRAVAMLLIIPVHEAAHAFVSYKLGDPTAKNYGRLTLNPLAHFDPFGALAMILAGIGWAKPVPTDVRRFRHPNGIWLFRPPPGLSAICSWPIWV